MLQFILVAEFEGALAAHARVLFCNNLIALFE